MKPKFRVPASKLKSFVDFVSFLKSKGAMSYFQYASNDAFQDDPGDWIIGAFVWEISENGHNFWFDINEYWVNKLEQNQ